MLPCKVKFVGGKEPVYGLGGLEKPLRPLRCGGVLNDIEHAEKKGLAKVTIHCSKLIAGHDYKTEADFEQAIKDHIGGCKSNPPCGAVTFGEGIPTWCAEMRKKVDKAARGNVEGVAAAAAARVTDEEIYDHFHDLYVIAPLRAKTFEAKAYRDLSQKVKVRHVTADEDTDLAIDLLCCEGTKHEFGVQIKSISYYKRIMGNPARHRATQRKNDKYGKPVIYLYYTPEHTWANWGGALKLFKRMLTDKPCKPEDCGPYLSYSIPKETSQRPAKRPRHQD